MFKKPIKVEIDAQTTKVDHEIRIPSVTEVQLHTLAVRYRKELVTVIAVAAVAKTSSEILIHIAKTKIQ